MENFLLIWAPKTLPSIGSGFVDDILVMVTLTHQDIKAYNRINKTHYGLLHKWSQNRILLERENFTLLKYVFQVHYCFHCQNFGK